jgi:hypothetical protein
MWVWLVVVAIGAIAYAELMAYRVQADTVRRFALIAPGIKKLAADVEELKREVASLNRERLERANTARNDVRHSILDDGDELWDDLEDEFKV